MAPNTAAEHAAQHAKSVLSIFMPIRMRELCKVEINSDRNQVSEFSFGNQPEDPARGCISARRNVPLIYITCQEINLNNPQNIHSRQTAASFPCRVSQPKAKNNRQISGTTVHLKNSAGNFKSEISFRAFRCPHPGGSHA
jgi:hypothetical protein